MTDSEEKPGEKVESAKQKSPDSITALDYIANQAKLEEEALEAMPYDPDHCTHHDEPARQQIFACLTCKAKNKDEHNGICYSCSIQCHSDHNVVELLTKRNFTCDCGTTRMASFGGCNLRKNFKQLDKPGVDNVYGHNFDGKFCSCNQEYSMQQGSTMFQCLLGDACREDWYHEECILGIPLIDRETKPQGENLYDKLESAESENVQAVDEDDDKTLDGLPNSCDFDAFVCWKCVGKHRAVMTKFGQWKDASLAPVIHSQFKSAQDRKEQLDPSSGSKRKADLDEEASKKQKTENGGAPSTALAKHSTEEFSLFLIEGYQTVLMECKDADVQKFIEKFPFMVEEEEAEYDPPADNDAASSLLDAGTRALQNLPREQALDGLNAYAMIKNQLKDFLKPFADEGKVVTETDVNTFFANMEAAK